MTTPRTPRGFSPVPVLHVRTDDGREFQFTQPFRVGRGEECELRVDDGHVSRQHLLVALEDGGWCFRDLQSSNGVFIDGERTLSAPIAGALELRLGGPDGPLLNLDVDAAASPTRKRSGAEDPEQESTRVIVNDVERYFGARKGGEPMGRRTMLIRQAFERVQKKQERKYAWIIMAVALTAVVAAGYAYNAQRKVRRQQALAEELFYAMKALDVDIANVERLMTQSGGSGSQDQVKRYLERRRKMESDYDTFLAGFKLYGQDLTEEQRLILRVTRSFGECELVAPPEYLSEVTTYIRKWQSTGRYIRAIKLAQDRGYVKKIAEEFIGRDLPPQFFYLAMQESDFDPFRSGPPTSMGIAKGMWQFIPETGTRYGLAVGPLVRYPLPDPRDDRQDWEKATGAAARYIKDIYATDAQASGLLVMASYNWGERRVIDLIRRMPPNPRERNFWKLLENYRSQVPKETYDYVFYIVSAAVIGENPRLFGFPFESPLVTLNRQ
jgi:pSer/pThr/pTyr-binding forkhead associated (FHA) protein